MELGMKSVRTERDDSYWWSGEGGVFDLDNSLCLCHCSWRCYPWGDTVAINPDPATDHPTACSGPDHKEEFGPFPQYCEREASASVTYTTNVGSEVLQRTVKARK